MARRRRGVVVMWVVVLMMSSFLHTQSIEQACLSQWSPCLAFLNGSLKPNEQSPKECCYAIKIISQSSQTCLCAFHSEVSSIQLPSYCLSLLPLPPPPPPPPPSGSPPSPYLPMTPPPPSFPPYLVPVPIPAPAPAPASILVFAPSMSPVNDGTSPQPQFNLNDCPILESPTPENKTSKIVIGVVLGVVTASISTIGAFMIIARRRKQKQRYSKLQELEELKKSFKDQTFFTYEELKVATRNFHPQNLLGRGGFGDVFKGVLADGSVVAVKQLSATSHQGKQQFLNEVESISMVQHRNLVGLRGCCIEGDRKILVYEFVENGSLDQHLFVADDTGANIIGWETRFKIMEGVARGLCYLHVESNYKIVHRDIKASNVLLDANLQPKISDFGLAKIFSNEETHIETTIAGTLGYLSPEYAMRGFVSDKTDVYSFGILTLEIVAGKRHTRENYILDYAWELYERGNILSLVDPLLGEHFSKAEAIRAIKVALLSTQTSIDMRPTMDRIIAMLLGDIEIEPTPTKPEIVCTFDFNQPVSYASKNITTDDCISEIVEGR